jgi:virginiamycin B lyase
VKRTSGLGSSPVGLATLARRAMLLACGLAVAGAGTASAAIFWVNTDGNSIGAANLGAARATSVNQRLIPIAGLDYGIAAGPDNDLYWSDTTNNRISRAHLYYDRRGRLRVRITRAFITGADHPEGVAVFGGHIYWANNDVFGSIGRAKLDGTQVEQNFVANESAGNGADLNYPVGVAVTGSYIYWADSNQNSLGRASTADGSGATQFITGLNDPRGVAVAGGFIYWADDLDNGTIGRANLDGTGVDQSFITGALGPCMVAVSGRYIYWANSGYGRTASTIGRARVDGRGATERYVTGAASPCGVAVDSFVLKTPKRQRR